MRILGLDYGSKTVGVAVSDPTGFLAQGITILRREKENHLRKTLREIDALIESYGVAEIVVGYPKNMNGTIGARAVMSEEFAELLRERTQLPVFLWDERLTTVYASRLLQEDGIRGADQKKYIDKIAAEMILQDYLDAKRAAAGGREEAPEEAQGE